LSFLQSQGGILSLTHDPQSRKLSEPAWQHPETIPVVNADSILGRISMNNADIIQIRSGILPGPEGNLPKRIINPLTLTLTNYYVINGIDFAI
jgi:hypothetical protein